MSIILQFPFKRSRVRASREIDITQSADILVFEGVRYEKTHASECEVKIKKTPNEKSLVTP